MTGPQLLQPTELDQRITLLDSLRGFALFGILFGNMTWFSAAFLPEDQRVALASANIDRGVYWLIQWLVDAKFWSMFAVLFGVGAALQWQRCRARGEPFTPMFVRRLSGLVLIGLAHAIFLWFGDIVSLYAVVGFGLLFFLHASDRAILGWAVVLLALPMIQHGVWLWLDPSFNTDHGPYDRLIHFASGSYDQVFATNWAFLVKRWILAVYEGRFFQLLGMFLIGFWAARRGVFREPQKHRALISQALIWGLVIGLPTNAWAASAGTPDSLLAVWILACIKTIGVPALCIAYIAGFLWVYSNGPLSLFRFAGRMSLTNYIVQTVIGIVIFYGCGFGYWGKIGISWGILLICVIYILQSLFSLWWLSVFRQGPLEWLWRCLTYGRILPLHRHR